MYNDSFTLEELGRNLSISLEVDVDYDYSPEEPMVRYYPDGSGYPGCPAYFEFVNFHVTEYNNYDDDLIVKRSQNPSFFEVLDKIAEKHILEREDYYTEFLSNEEVY